MSGGQAVVNFARGADGGFFQYAIKFASALLLAFCLRIVAENRRRPGSGRPRARYQTSLC